MTGPDEAIAVSFRLGGKEFALDKSLASVAWTVYFRRILHIDCLKMEQVRYAGDAFLGIREG